jgi:hypothetical protein
LSSQAQTIDHSRDKAIDFQPLVEVEQKHDDNIFQEPKDEAKGDWITIVTLSGELQMPLVKEKREDSLLKARYDADIVEFWRRRKLDRIDHTVACSADVPLNEDLTFMFTEDFNRTSEPPNEELRGFHKRFYNEFAGALQYKVNDKIELEAAYLNTRIYYYKLKSNNNYHHIASGRVLYNIAPKLDFFGLYKKGVRFYDKTGHSDSESNEWHFGLEGEITERLEGIIEGGYNNVEYEVSNLVLDEFVMNVELSYDLQERTTLDISYDRETRDSTLYHESYYEMNRVEIGLSHELLKRLSLSAEMFYQHDRYPYTTAENRTFPKRRDDIWQGSVELSYEVLKERLFLEAAYEYKQSNSTFDTQDYKSNIISTKVSLLF